MTVTSTVAPHWQYLGDGVTTVFPFTSLVLDPTDLVVYVDGLVQSYAVHYTVAGVGVPTGGTITFVSPPGIVTIDILRLSTADQPRSFPLSGPFPSTTVERALDDLVNQIQELRRDVARAPLLNALSAPRTIALADPVAEALLRWKTDLSGLEAVSLATLSPGSVTLPLSLVNGGSGAGTALGARQTYGVDGQVRKMLSNRTGGILVLGDVVALDTANDAAVALGDTVSSKAQLVVALGTIANAASGEFLLSGVGTVNVTGAVTRGRYLRKSATPKVAEDAGTLHGAATDPPQGSFGVALTAAVANQVTARLFGFTSPGTAATPIVTGVYAVKGLTGANNAGTPNSQFDFAADLATLRDPSGGGTLVTLVGSRTLNTATAGPAAGGRDQAGAFSANSWIYAYLIAKTDGTYHVTASLTAPPTGPALPAGYTLWAPLGALRIDNSSNLIRTRLREAWASYDAAQIVVTDGRATVETAVACSSLVPPNAANFRLLLDGFNRRGSNQYPTFRVVSGVDYDLWGPTFDIAGIFRSEVTMPNVAQQFYYLYGADPTATNGLYAYVRGYENPI